MEIRRHSRSMIIRLTVAFLIGVPLAVMSAFADTASRSLDQDDTDILASLYFAVESNDSEIGQSVVTKCDPRLVDTVARNIILAYVNQGYIASDRWTKVLTRYFRGCPNWDRTVLLVARNRQDRRDYRGAAALFGEIINCSSNNIRDTFRVSALLGAARCHEQLNERPVAISLYQRIVREYPDFPEKGVASIRLRILGSE